MDQKMISHPAAQAVPSVALVGTQVLGLGLPDWAAVFGIVFIVIQGAYLLWKWRKESKHGN